MTDGPKPRPTLESERAMFLELSESLDPFIEFTIGYRKKLENQGFSPTAAEQAALSMLIALQTKAITG